MLNVLTRYLKHLSPGGMAAVVRPARPLARAAQQRLADLTRPVGTEEVMSVDYPTPRLKVSVTQAAGVGIALLFFLGLWLALQPPWQGSQSPPDLSAFSEYTTAPSTSVVSLPESGEIVVAVVGAVTHPGLVTLSSGARVADALKEAQPLPDAQVEAVNLAEKLQDGRQITVPHRGVGAGGSVAQLAAGASSTTGSAVGSSSASSAATGATPISINTADTATLEQIPGVGEKTAAAIIDYRTTNGPFSDISQLEEVKGIGPAKLDSMKDFVTL